MRTVDIIKEIRRLPLNKRMYVIEKTILSIRQQQDSTQMKKAAAELYVDYCNDKELTNFTTIDFDDVNRKS